MDKRAGSESILTKLSELMFIDVIRRYIEALPAHDDGWLADDEVNERVPGHSLEALRRRMHEKDSWIVNDDAQRSKAMEAAKRDMDRVAQIGGKRMAAPAAGAQDRADVDLMKAAQRYRALCELGEKFGVVPPPD